MILLTAKPNELSTLKGIQKFFLLLTNRDLPKAEIYYKQAIEAKERLESSIKDLATVLHQQGKTLEAIKFLEENRNNYPGDQSTYDNLLSNLRKQV